MHALKPSYFQPQPLRRHRTVPRLKPQRPYQAIVLETTVRLSVNVVLSVVAISALAQLLPYRASQETKLQELQVAVKSASDRVQQVQTHFKQYFDPYQVNANMQAQSGRIGVRQRRIVWQEPGKQ